MQITMKESYASTYMHTYIFVQRHIHTLREMGETDRQTEKQTDSQGQTNKTMTEIRAFPLSSYLSSYLPTHGRTAIFAQRSIHGPHPRAAKPRDSNTPNKN